MKIRAAMRNVLGTALLALTLLGLTGCPWSQALNSYTMIYVYNRTGEEENGNPNSTPCIKGLQVVFFDYHDASLQFSLSVAPGDSEVISGPALSSTSPNYQNPHYRIEAYCITDSQTGKSVREVQGERLIFEIRPPNFKTGENPDEVSPPGPWIIEKGLLP